MALKDEDVILLKYADENTFNTLYSENVKVESKKSRTEFITKLLLFLLLLLSNAYIFFYEGYIRYFSSFGTEGILLNGNPGSFLSSFIFGALCIWLPSNILTSIGKLKVDSGASSGSNMTITPALAFRFFGWVIFALPTVIFIISSI